MLNNTNELLGHAELLGIPATYSHLPTPTFTSRGQDFSPIQFLRYLTEQSLKHPVHRLFYRMSWKYDVDWLTEEAKSLGLNVSAGLADHIEFYLGAKRIPVKLLLNLMNYLKAELLITEA